MEFSMDIKALYENKLAEHGPNHLGLGYKSPESQHRRWRVLAQHQHPEPNVRYTHMLDVGCGLGGFVNFRPPNCCYTGIDVVPAFIQEATARNRHLSNVTFKEQDIIETVADDYRYALVVASGLFAWQSMEFMQMALSLMWEKCWHTMAFNFQENTTTLSYIVMLLRGLGIKNYTMRHDYGLDDYTVYCYKLDSDRPVPGVRVEELAHA